MALAENRILARLSPEMQQRLARVLQPVDLEQKQILFEPNQRIRDVYLPRGGLCSILSVSPQGESIEVAVIGREGVMGLSAVLGVESVPFRGIMQIAAPAFRIEADTLAELAETHDELRHLLYRYNSALLTQVMQCVACNGLHSVHQRCCRWLLMAQDRVGENQLALTHEFLAQMIGVRRASVSEVLKPLQDDELIRYRRGRIEILDRDRLIASSCDCYCIVRDQFQRLLGSEAPTLERASIH